MTMTNPVLVGDGLMPIAKSGPWAVNFHSDDFRADGDLNQELKVAPDAGKATYITHVTMGVVGNTLTEHYVIDCRLSLIDGGDASIAFGPIHFQERGQSVFSKDFDSPLKITDSSALDLTGVGGSETYYSACFVYIEGFTGQKPIV